MSVETVKPLSLPSVPLLERRSLPQCAAVYFVQKPNFVAQ